MLARGLLMLGLLATLAPSDALRWLDHIVPKKSERTWAGIGWQPTLWDAVERAHEQKKPIVLWAMNGHPLACT